MAVTRLAKVFLVGFGCLGLLEPSALSRAAERRAIAGDCQGHDGVTPVVCDIELDSDGRLRGVVVDIGGCPVAGVGVLIEGHGHEEVRAPTDARGWFSAVLPRGGTYRLSVGNQGLVVRAWTAGTAPPISKPTALIVVQRDVVRGQMPLECFFASDAFVITSMVGAMIAIPVTVHHRGGGQPASP